jgi:hypothetical protein
MNVGSSPKAFRKAKMRLDRPRSLTISSSFYSRRPLFRTSGCKASNAFGVSTTIFFTAQQVTFGGTQAEGAEFREPQCLLA